ncbi:MAG: uracil phosphoribosyltransferase [Anaerotignum sp.]|nr:uracil phosphoribosyltransferase [Anaerotignum sp.]
MSRFFVSEHPLIHTKMAMLRDKETGTKEFREMIGEVASLLFYEATRELPMVDVEVQTPIAMANCKTIDTKLAIVPILRAGIGMTDGILNLVPTTKIGHIGLYRDEETLEPVEYYCKLPADVQERTVLLTDPMLATGGSADMAIDALKKRGVKKIIFLCILAAPDGVERLQKNHPDVDIFAAAYDGKLNENGYIVPGLGDAGDRIFGTK